MDCLWWRGVWSSVGSAPTQYVRVAAVMASCGKGQAALVVRVSDVQDWADS
jgi:hypothetical protein